MVHIPFSGTIKEWWEQRKFLSELERTKWQFSQTRLHLLLNEGRDWARYYLPIDLTGLTVLDVGAGEGETAKFFLDHGAAKIICIEPDPRANKILETNAFNHPGKIEIHPKFFELSDLSLKHDFMKMDIEGYEESLLSGAQLPVASVIEVHGLQLRDKFKKQNYRIDNTPNINGINCISFAYWNC